MAKELTKEMLGKMRAELNAKQITKPEGEAAPKLSEADLEKVAGGFYEPDVNMGAWQQWVQCPGCRASDISQFDVTDNDFVYFTEYRCRVCGRRFLVDNDGYTYDYDAVYSYGNRYNWW